MSASLALSGKIRRSGNTGLTFPCGHNFLKLNSNHSPFVMSMWSLISHCSHHSLQSSQQEARPSIALYHRTGPVVSSCRRAVVLHIHALSKVESDSPGPIALIYLICQAPEDIGFCDLRLQVWVGGESSEALPLPRRQTEPYSPRPDLLLEGWALFLSPYSMGPLMAVTRALFLLAAIHGPLFCQLSTLIVQGDCYQGSTFKILGSWEDRFWFFGQPTYRW